jgi:hypothetical protein
MRLTGAFFRFTATRIKSASPGVIELRNFALWTLT